MKKLFKILFILSAFIINTQTGSCKNNLTIPVQNTSQNNYIEQNSDFKAGVNFILNSQYQEAINCFNTYLNNNKSVNPDVYFQRGYAYMAMGDKENAYNNFQLALRHNPNNVYALVNYINIKFTYDPSDESLINEISRAFNIINQGYFSPKFLTKDTQTNTISVYSSQPNKVNTDNTFKNSVLSNLYYICAITRYQNQKLKQCFMNAEMSYKLDPTNLNSLDLMKFISLNELNNGDSSVALDYIQKTINALDNNINTQQQNSYIDSIYLTLYECLGSALFNLERYDESISAYTKALEYAPKNSELYFYRAEAFYQTNYIGQALSDLDNAIKYDYKNEMAYILRAEIKTENSDYQGAIEDYTKALYINPNNAHTFFKRALVKTQKQDINGALVDYNQVTKLAPDSAAAYFNRALIYKRQNKHSLALSEMTKAKILYNNIGDTEYYNKAINFINQWK